MPVLVIGAVTQVRVRLEGVADEHDLALGPRVREGAHERRQHHVEEGEHGHQCRGLPGRRLRRLQQFDGGNEQRVVGERREELRRHDGVETALHPVRRGAGSGLLMPANFGCLQATRGYIT